MEVVEVLAVLSLVIIAVEQKTKAGVARNKMNTMTGPTLISVKKWNGRYLL